jgi:hypothetical protein
VITFCTYSPNLCNARVYLLFPSGLDGLTRENPSLSIVPIFSTTQKNVHDMFSLLVGISVAGGIATEPMFSLSKGISVAVSSSISWLYSGERGVWVVRRLEGSLSSLVAARRSQVCVLITELLAVPPDDDAGIEGEQEVDDETDDDPWLVLVVKDALATGLDIRLTLVCDFLSSDGGGGCVGLGDAFGDEVVLDRLVKERDGESDRVDERGKELEPEEDGEGADEGTRADEGTQETREGDEGEEGVDCAGYDDAYFQVFGEFDIVLGACEQGKLLV